MFFSTFCIQLMMLMMIKMTICQALWQELNIISIKTQYSYQAFMISFPILRMRKPGFRSLRSCPKQHLASDGDRTRIQAL